MNKLSLAVGAMILALTGVVQADTSRANLNPLNENPVVLAFGNGELKVKLSSDDLFTYELSYESVSSPVLQAHIHLGKAWENGGIIAFLCTNLGNQPDSDHDVPPCPESSGTVTGTIDADDVVGPIANDLARLRDVIESGAAYANVHSAAHPPGHMRGQLTQ